MTTINRREFLRQVGKTLAATSLASVLPLGCEPVQRQGISRLSQDNSSNSSAKDRSKIMKYPTIINTVSLRVGDIDHVAEFYKNIIGLSILYRDSVSTVLGIEESQTTLLILESDPDAPVRDPRSAGLFHIAFRVPDEASLADALRRITSHGYRLDGASNHDVSYALYLRDPENNGLEIYVDMPDELWPRDSANRIQMGTRRLDINKLLSHKPTGKPEQMPSGTDIGHIHLEGVQIKQAHQFYITLLGLDTIIEAPSVLFTSHGGYHHHVGINIWNRRSSPRDKTARGLMAIDASLPGTSLADIMATATRLGYNYDYDKTENLLSLDDRDNITWRFRLS